MSGSLLYEALAIRGGPDGDTSATFTRWPDSPAEPLVRGQRVTITCAFDAREWRVTDVRPHPDGSETYDLLPAEVVDEAERAARLCP